MTDRFYSVATPPIFEAPVHILIAVSTHDRDTADHMVDVAVHALAEQGATQQVVEVIYPADLPAGLAMGARMSQFDGFLALSPPHQDAAQMQETAHRLGLWTMQGHPLGTVLPQGSAPSDQVPEAVNALLHLVAMGRKWSAQRKGVGFRPHSNQT